MLEIADRSWVRWTLGFVLPLGCFVVAFATLGGLPTDLEWPRAAVLAAAASSLAAMALSTRRRARGRSASMLLGGALAGGALFALAHTVQLGLLMVSVALVVWPLLPVALAPPAAFLVYALCAIDEVTRARQRGWTAFAVGLMAPLALAAGAAHAARTTESLLIARLVEPEAELDARELAPLRAIGWVDRWSRIQSVRREWLDEDPPAYSGRALRARQVLHALTGEFEGPAPGGD